MMNLKVDKETLIKAREWFKSLPIIKSGKPLKIGVLEDLLAIAPKNVSEHALKIVISEYTRSTPYLEGIVNGKERFNLDGQVDGKIGYGHAAYARGALDERARWEKKQQRVAKLKPSPEAKPTEKPKVEVKTKLGRTLLSLKRNNG